jgi:hypothetical protein
VHIPLADLDFRDRMAEEFGLPVAIDNDANAAAIAEWRLGAGRGTSHMVLLTLGTGIGGGLILDGRPYRGSIGVEPALAELRGGSGSQFDPEVVRVFVDMIETPPDDEPFLHALMHAS